jgi:LacI family transcriptional regulator
MPTRMKDIAEDLNVSVVTVSKVLRNEGRIGAATRERVLRRAQELNYRPNLTARSLVTGRTFLVGLVVPDLIHPFFAAIAKTISAHIRSCGYSLVLASSEEDPELEREEIESLLSRRVDALVLASSQSSAESGIFQRIEEQKVPYVLVDRMVPGVNAHFVGVNDETIGVLATEHLVERGYRRIAHIRGPGLSTGNGRFQGYQRVLKRHRYQVPPGYVAFATSTDEHGEQCGFSAMQELLAIDPRPDAVFCYNDILAFGALKAILDAGLSVPGDVAVIGASNLSGLYFWNAVKVPLSTVDQSIADIGERAAELVLKLVQSCRRYTPRKILLPAKLVVRSST